MCMMASQRLVKMECQIIHTGIITFMEFMTKPKFHIVKGINNAFDHMELCFVL